MAAMRGAAFFSLLFVQFLFQLHAELPPAFDRSICSTATADVEDLNTNLAWTNGIVPYDFTSNHTVETKSDILAAMKKWEKYTCLRFVPWVSGTTRLTYGLPDEGHILFRNENSCNSALGNRHDAAGQVNRCCKRGVCVHEIAHSLGIDHEHRDVHRRDYVDVKWDAISPSEWLYYEVSTPLTLIERQYDIFSKMHYGYPTQWRYLFEDLRRVRDDSMIGKVSNEVLIQPNHFYMYKDGAFFHDCKGMYCSTSDLQCVNDGYVAYVDGVCTCACPEYFDPATGCATTLKQVTTSSQWPAGSYALVASVDGCPEGTSVFETGSWKHTGKGPNTFSSEVKLGGVYTATSFQYNFCVKSTSSDGAGAPVWEAGRYCIMRVGGLCPTGFKSGWIQYDDSSTIAGVGSGSLPDGVYVNDTRQEFCCRDDGSRDVPLQNLPNTRPLVLFNSHYDSAEGCQTVAGMRSYLQYISYISFTGVAAYAGEYPNGADTSKLYYCYYVPVNMQCGGEITLNSTNNQVTVSSPNYPSLYGTNLECAWYIKTDNLEDKILLNFDNFQVTSSDPLCRLEDALEIRYGLIGQPGPKYCGSYMGRTVRSFFNTVILVFRTDYKQAATDIGFSVTATVFKPATDECYEPSTKGVYYRGTKDYTRSMRQCLDWASVPQCNDTAFDIRDFGSGLEKNYCRNPDYTAMPWCYTDTSCERDYCDVCNIEVVYDREPSLCSASVCSKTRSEILALGCAGTCNLQAPAAPVRTSTCTAPPEMPDAVLLGTAQSSYNQGDNITYQCSTGDETAVSFCTSDGQWSAKGYVCGGCKDGWAYYGGACYRMYNFCAVNYLTARQYCADQGAYLSTMKDPAELNHLLAISRTRWEFFFGLTDIASQGTAVWEDGTPLGTGWSNWYANVSWVPWGDCTYARASWDQSKWIMNDCTTFTKRMFACKYKLSGKNPAVCADRTNCQSALQATPDLCTSKPIFADQQCPFSCGLCQPDSTPQCSVQAPSTTQLVTPQGVTNVPRGATVKVSCLPDFTLMSGMLTRACGSDGNLVGPPPVCTDVGESNTITLKARTETTTAGYAYITQGLLLISRNAVVKQWKYYSSTPGITVFQVWRPDPVLGFASMSLVGQNEVMTKGSGVESFDVPDYDLIQVKPGDALGTWEPYNIPSGNVRAFSTCDATEQGKYLTGYTSFGSYGDFSRSRKFSLTAYGCRVFSFKAVLHGVASMPAERSQVTSQVNLVTRTWKPASYDVWFGTGPNYLVPVDGYISTWQFHNAKNFVGSGALQVWRLVNQATNSYKLIGQNMFNITTAAVDTLYNVTVAEGERIAVKAGDVIASWSGSPRWGVSYQDCAASTYQEAGATQKKTFFYAATAAPYTVQNFTASSSPCVIFSYRAVISQDPNRPTCSTAPVNANVIFKEPQGQTTVPWGTTATYACASGYSLISGSLVLTCDQTGSMAGVPPTCA